MSKCAILVWMVVALVGGVGTAHGQDATLKAQAVVKGPNLMLGELAILEGFEPAVNVHLAGLSIGASPRVGLTQRLTRAAVEQRVRAQSNGLAIRWFGPEEVVVQRAATTVAGSDIVDKAALHLYQLLGLQGQRVSIQPMDELADIPVAQGHVDILVRAMPYSEALRKRATVWVDVLVDGKFYRAVSVAFLVEVWRMAWVSSVPALSGDTLRCEELEKREMNLTDLPVALSVHGFLTAPCVGDGFRVRRTLARGQALLPGSVAAHGTLLAGDTVSLKSIGRGVSVEVPAVLLSDARPVGSGRAAPSRVRAVYLSRILDAEADDRGVVTTAAGAAEEK